MDNKVYVIMYHYVRDLEHSRYPRIKGLDIARFRKQIEYLKQNFTVITMEELNCACNNQYKLPNKQFYSHLTMVIWITILPYFQY